MSSRDGTREIEDARDRLDCAKSSVDSALKVYEAAKAHLETVRNQLTKAQSHLTDVERRWNVIDVDGGGGGAGEDAVEGGGESGGLRCNGETRPGVARHDSAVNENSDQELSVEATTLRSGRLRVAAPHINRREPKKRAHILVDEDESWSESSHDSEDEDSELEENLESTAADQRKRRRPTKSPTKRGATSVSNAKNRSSNMVLTPRNVGRRTNHSNLPNQTAIIGDKSDGVITHLSQREAARSLNERDATPEHESAGNESAILTNSNADTSNDWVKRCPELLPDRLPSDKRPEAPLSKYDLTNRSLSFTAPRGMLKPCNISSKIKNLSRKDLFQFVEEAMLTNRRDRIMFPLLPDHSGLSQLDVRHLFRNFADERIADDASDVCSGTGMDSNTIKYSRREIDIINYCIWKEEWCRNAVSTLIPYREKTDIEDAIGYFMEKRLDLDNAGYLTMLNDTVGKIVARENEKF